MQDILKSVSDFRYQSSNKISEEEKKESADYVLTLDNFFKMCLIIQRFRSGIPCIIEGESGVGKTALISYLVKRIYGTRLIVCNIHAGVHEKELV